jgi:HemY protein
MLISVLRILLFLLLAGLAVTAVYHLFQSPDGVAVTLGGYEFVLSPIDILLVVLVVAIPLIAALPTDSMLAAAARVAQFLVLVVAGIWVVMRLIELPGSVTIAIAGREVYFTPIAFAGLLVAALLVLWLLFRLASLVLAVVRFVFGDETAISRYFDRSRERRGLEAMARGMTALAAGDAKQASARALKAERLLQRPELTRLLNAQAHEAAGDSYRARAYYHALAEDPATAFVGVRGLLNQALAEDDNDRALKLAERAAELRPREASVLDTLYMLQSRKFDWAAARKTLDSQRRAGLLPKPEANRRDAMLALAQADDAEEAGEGEHARKLALEAARLDPDNSEATATAARLLVAAGSKRAAAKMLTGAWRRRPDSRLAAAFAAIEPEESAHERRLRFGKLLQANTGHPETRLLSAELALVTNDWAAARKAMEGLKQDEPTARSCAIWAAIARGEGRPEAEVRGWLAKALDAPRDEAVDGETSQAAMLTLLVGDDTEAEVEEAEEIAPDAAPEPPEDPGRTAA